MPIYISPPSLPHNDDAQDFLTSVFLITISGSQHPLNLTQAFLPNIVLSSYLLELTKNTFIYLFIFP